MKSYRHVLDRRTFLRGAGGVAIALPFLEEMRARSVWAAPLPAQPRCITVFFSNGCSAEFVEQGLKGPLAPWRPLVEGKKMSIYAGIKFPGAFHEAGAIGCFTGSYRKGDNAGGISIDQQILRAAYPQGAPTNLQTVSMGPSFRRNGAWRHVHSWTAQGSPAAVPSDTPAALFEQLFGKAPAANQPGHEGTYAKSVLDVVVEDYKRFTGPSSGLGAASREKIRAHLDYLQTLERQAQGAAPTCAKLAYEDPNFLGGNLTASATPSTTPADFARYWRVMADIYALGLHCDVMRFGNALFGGAAERYRLRGPHQYDGEAIQFNDAIDCHEQFHQSPVGQPLPSMRWHLHFIMEQVVYLLRRLDDPQYAVEGKTFLDRNLVMVSTELGNGSRHETDKVFHAISGAGGRFKTGVINTTEQLAAVDFYNGCLVGMGIEQKMGALNLAKGPYMGHLA